MSPTILAHSQAAEAARSLLERSGQCANQALPRLSANKAREALETLERTAALERLRRICQWSPVYRHWLGQHPAEILWLEHPEVREREFWEQRLRTDWKRDFATDSASTLPAALWQFRRRMQLRVAYRLLGRLCDWAEASRELSRLAEFCIGTAVAHAWGRWQEKMGTPWNESLDQPARFAVLAMGKLGAEELNFWSDVDLLFLYEGQGHCRRPSGGNGRDNVEFFTRLSREIVAILGTREEHRPIFEVDLRLRPEGESGPIVRPLSALEHYYFTAGQPWERMALIRARGVGGDRALAEELLESLHTFRYPRRPSPGLLTETSGLKRRFSDKASVKKAGARDIKHGPGGIREIEYFVQAQQLLFGGANPFLQTHQTLPALDQLARYELISEPARDTFKGAYALLREVEHRLQIQHERRSLELPEDPAELDLLAQLLDFADGVSLMAELEATGRAVREAYDQLFEGEQRARRFEAWRSFFTGEAAEPGIADCLRRWFRNEPDAVREPLQTFLLGGPRNLVTREHIFLFEDLAQRFDAILPRLADPLATLLRISQLAEAYGTRKAFLRACAENASLLDALSILFDRSSFIFDLMRRQPDMVEDLLRAGLRRRKESEDFCEEIGRLPGNGGTLLQYVRTEEVRIASAEALGLIGVPAFEEELSDLADSVALHLLRESDPEGVLALVGLGKWGGRELTPGSDLDLLLLSAPEAPHQAVQAAARFFRRVVRSGQGDPIYEADLRLRPHGSAGSLVISVPALEAYQHSDSAQAWERLLLTRARPLGGNRQWLDAFAQWREGLLYAGPLEPDYVAELWEMRLKIQRAKTPASPEESWRAVKSAPGGLLDIEFIAQMLQCHLGREHPGVRQPNTRLCLEALTAVGQTDPAAISRLLENYHFLRGIERLLRLNSHSGVSEIPDNSEIQDALAHWTGTIDRNTLRQTMSERMKDTRQIAESVLNGTFAIRGES